MINNSHSVAEKKKPFILKRSWVLVLETPKLSRPKIWMTGPTSLQNKGFSIWRIGK